MLWCALLSTAQALIVLHYRPLATQLQLVMRNTVQFTRAVFVA
jgi:hypothetical protein